MEVCAPFFAASFLDIRNSSGSAQDQGSFSPQAASVFSMNDLKTCLTDTLGSEDIFVCTSASASRLNLSSGKDDTSCEVAGYHSMDTEKTNHGGTGSAESFCKSAMYSASHGPRSADSAAFGDKGKHEEEISKISEQNGSANNWNQPVSRPLSLLASSKLLSAMKGGREKKGIPPKKLSVTWAPDVYDPIPTSVSHVPSHKNQRHHSDGKKSGKYKQKGGSKTSRSIRGKDKKWKSGSNSYNRKPFHEDIEVVDPGIAQLGRLELMVETQVRPAEVVF